MRSTLLLCLFLVSLIACNKDKPAEATPTDESAQENQDTMARTEESKPAEPSEPATPKVEVATNDLKLEGTLKFEEAPRVKSAKAFVHQEFVLTTADGTTHGLKSGDVISYDQLKAQDGKSIKITCTPKAAPAPNPMESAPSGVERPSSCVVTSLEAM